MKTLKKDKISLILLIYNIIILALSIGYFSYALLLLQNIETLLRIIIMLFFVFLSIMIVKSIIKNTFKRKKIKILITTVIATTFAIAIIIIGYNVNKIYSAIKNISSNSQTYSSSIVSRKDSDIESLDDIKKEKIGILNDVNSIDGYQIPQEIIKENKLENEIIEYNNYLDLINDLLNEKINIIFLPTNYAVLFSSISGLEELDEKTKIIYTKDKNVKIESTLNTKNLDEPFSVLLMGVDSENENIAGSSFNGDSLIVITFNPKTLNATMLSIPRDTYTSISCFAGQRKNKITHAAWYGESCMINTISNMFDIDIDYYVKINFKGLVNIIDSLGGVDVEVPFSFCEQNSNREFGDKMIYVRKGFQTLNGEQALALARNRHTHAECGAEFTNYNSNDFIRGQNQQLVIQGMINKLKNINSIDTFYDMLNSISASMETNMQTENILSFYNIGKDILIKNTNNTSNLSELIGFERLYLSGYDQMIVDYDTINNTGSGLMLYNFVPYQGSIKDISNAMKINLNLMQQQTIKEFAFNVNEPYEQRVIGKDYYNEGGVSILPSFVGRDLSEAQNYFNARGISITINKVTTNSKSLDNQIMTQSLPSGMDVQFISRSKGITLGVAEYKTNEKPNKDDDITTTIPGLNNEDDDKPTTKPTNEKPKEDDNNTVDEPTPNEPTKPTKPTPDEPIVPGTPTEDEKEKETETKTE
ncbi:MAG: LCP family protein [Bacilli bacterium]|nr:LCP family protein [Bacilli bacterium]